MVTHTLLNAVAATGASASLSMNTTPQMAQVTGTFVATVHLEGSNDGTNWVSIGNVTAAGSIANTAAWAYVRGNVTAYTSGTVTMVIAAGSFK